MLKKLREALCFMDPKKRMAGSCEQPELDDTEAEFLLFKIRSLT